MFLNILKFNFFLQIHLHVLESIGVYLNVLENIISMLVYLPPTFWPYERKNYQLPVI